MTEPRVFTPPDPEPGPEVEYVVDPEGDVWKPTSKGWVAHLYGGDPIPWAEMLDGVGWVQDATGEVTYDGGPDFNA